MLDIKKLDHLWDDENFHALVNAFIGHIQSLQNTTGMDAYTANSALLFTNALIYEGSPYYESDKRLKEAEALSTYETALMFKYLRRYKKQTGHSLLLSILADQSAVKNKVKLN